VLTVLPDQTTDARAAHFLEIRNLTLKLAASFGSLNEAMVSLSDMMVGTTFTFIARWFEETDTIVFEEMMK